MAVEPLARHLQRALLYIRLVNDGGYYPSSPEVDQYAIRKEPDPPSRYLTGIASLVRNVHAGTWVNEGEAVARYMQAVYWVRPHESGGLQLTRLGAALVRGRC